MWEPAQVAPVKGRPGRETPGMALFPPPQVVPANQVDDIDEVHELGPVHQVDHKDERCDDIGRFCVEVVCFCGLQQLVFFTFSFFDQYRPRTTNIDPCSSL